MIVGNVKYTGNPSLYKQFLADLVWVTLKPSILEFLLISHD